MGGGGDGGFGERQDAQDASRASARSRLNALFGEFTPSGLAVDRARFTTPATPGSGLGDGRDGQPVIDPTPGGFDQAGFDAAVAAAGGTDDERMAEAARNRTGLEALFGSTRNDAFAAGRRKLDEGHGQASRDLNFELIARGQNGGSGDIDQHALLNRLYTGGLTDLGGKADATANQFRGDNEAARLQLLQSIDSGMDAGSAVSSALGQMRVNTDRAAADAIGTNVGDLFGTSALIYNQNRVAQGRQNAANWWQQPGQGGGGGSGGGSGARTGIVTRTR